MTRIDLYELYLYTVSIATILTLVGGLIGGLGALFNMYPPISVMSCWMFLAFYTLIGIFTMKRRDDWAL